MIKRLFKGLLLAMMMVGLVPITAGCQDVSGSWVVIGSGRYETQTYDYNGFTRIVAGPNVEVAVFSGETTQVAVTADDNLFDYFDIHQVEDTLYLGLSPVFKFVNSTQKVKVVVPDLEYLELNAFTRGTISGFECSHPLALKITAASNLGLSSMNVGDTSMEISGASRVSGDLNMDDVDLVLSGFSKLNVSGTGNSMYLDVSGASHADLSGLPARDAHVNLSGAAEVNLELSGYLEGDLSGASRLTYSGGATPGKINISGGSRVESK